MKKKILIVDDEIHIQELISYHLERSGYIFKSAYNGTDALNMIYSEKFDLILLDLMLPEIDGIEIIKRIRLNDKLKNLPVIMLTALGEESDKVIGLELGSDDYITKPFSTRELLARIKALLRRSDAILETSNSSFTLGPLTLSEEKHEVYLNQTLIDLTFKEFSLLLMLFKYKGKVLSRDVLLNSIWGYEYYGDTRTVDVHIRHLRQKLESDSFHFIETIRGVGYKIGDTL